MPQRQEVIEDICTHKVEEIEEIIYEKEKEDEKEATLFQSTNTEVNADKCSSRYVSILRKPNINSTHASVGYSKLGKESEWQKKGNSKHNNIHLEEVVEEVVYTHHIHELIVYEDEIENEIIKCGSL